MSAPVISADTLYLRLQNEAVRLLRVLMRDPTTGQADSADSDVIAGTCNLDLDEAASDHKAGGVHTMPAVDVLENLLTSLSVTPDSPVVVYDNRGVFCSPRVWWMLRSLGHTDVHVLDGGLPGWLEEEKPVQQGTEVWPAEPAYTASPQLGWFVDADVVQHESENGGQIIDARGPGRFNGTEPEPRKGVRSGHIPGSVNIHYQTCLEKGRFKSAELLQDIFSTAGISLTKPIICTCGSGITACIVGMAAKMCGATNVSVYDGSWAEWGADPRRPVEVA